MSTPIPGFATQVIASGYTVQVTTSSGTLQTLNPDHFYYFVSNRATSGDGQSLLLALKLLLQASLAGTTWTVVLTKVGATYRIQLSHNNGSARAVALSPSFATALGFATASFSVGAGVTVTADYPSAWWWTPDQAVSLTGPEMFDHNTSIGVPSSAGASQRSPDMTSAHVRNGEQWEAQYIFTMIEGLYMARAVGGAYTNRDVETWWRNGPQLGRKFLMWRSRDNAMGSNAPSKGSGPPTEAWRYVEYGPDETLRGKMPCQAFVPNNIRLWDVTLGCWVTPNVDTPLVD